MEDLLKNYSACTSSHMAIYILEFIRDNYKSKYTNQAGVQKYVDALNIGIEAIKEKYIKE